MTRVLVGQPDEGRSCPYCLVQLRAGTQAVRCDACGALHHEACWLHLSGCAVHGCLNSAREPAARPVPVRADAPRPARARRSWAPSRGLIRGAIALGAIGLGTLGILLALGHTGGMKAARTDTGEEQTETSTVPEAGVPGSYAGPFTSVDRLQHCRATERSAVCTSAGSGVRLDAGQGTTRLGPDGSNAEGPRLALNTSFRTPSGSIECISSSRGITCRDLMGTSASFTISGRGVVTTGPTTR